MSDKTAKPEKNGSSAEVFSATAEKNLAPVYQQMLHGDAPVLISKEVTLADSGRYLEKEQRYTARKRQEQKKFHEATNSIKDACKKRKQREAERQREMEEAERRRLAEKQYAAERRLTVILWALGLLPAAVIAVFNVIILIDPSVIFSFLHFGIVVGVSLVGALVYGICAFIWLKPFQEAKGYASLVCAVACAILVMVSMCHANDGDHTVGTAEELKSMSNYPISGEFTITLSDDIDFQDSGFQLKRSYKGELDGDGHTVTGLSSDKPFCQIIKGTVRNTVFEDNSFKGSFVDTVNKDALLTNLTFINNSFRDNFVKQLKKSDVSAFLQLAFEDCTFESEFIGLMRADVNECTFSDCDFEKDFVGSADRKGVFNSDRPSVRDCRFDSCTFNSLVCDTTIYKNRDYDKVYWLSDTTFTQCTFASESFADQDYCRGVVIDQCTFLYDVGDLFYRNNQYQKFKDCRVQSDVH